MTLKIKTNRNDMLRWWLLFLIPMLIAYSFMITYTYILKSHKSETGLVIFGSVVLGVQICILLFFKFYNRRLHVFTIEKIQVFNGKKLIDSIDIKDVTEIKYIKCNIQYLWERLSGGSMSNGYACKMYVQTKQGNCYIIGRFSAINAKKIKNLYGNDLVQLFSY